jgi:hypothetical protein
VSGFICDDIADLPDALRRVGELDPDRCAGRVAGSFGADLMARRYEQVYLRAMTLARTSAASILTPVELAG